LAIANASEEIDVLPGFAAVEAGTITAGVVTIATIFIAATEASVGLLDPEVVAATETVVPISTAGGCSAPVRVSGGNAAAPVVLVSSTRHDCFAVVVIKVTGGLLVSETFYSEEKLKINQTSRAKSGPETERTRQKREEERCAMRSTRD
jgi:hypothetical protein